MYACYKMNMFKPTTQLQYVNISTQI